MGGGERTTHRPEHEVIDEARERFRRESALLPEELARLDDPKPIEAERSEALRALTDEVRRSLESG
ncbi:MAG: hypothetical protein U5R31_05975 [Acidimicrobiia bacterium]|nr:hypothetical protein [Acidimicrobiia bacterium]